MSSKTLENYMALLIIRQRAKRRDAIITGVVFFGLFAALVVVGMLGTLNERSLFLAAVLVTLLRFGFLATWVRYEIVKGSIEVVDNLCQMDE